jgi:hypothetical protein
MVYFSLGVIICGKTVTGISSMDLCVFCVILEIVTSLCCFVSAHLGILSLCFLREVQRYLYSPASYHCPLFWDLSATSKKNSWCYISQHFYWPAELWPVLCSLCADDHYINAGMNCLGLQYRLAFFKAVYMLFDADFYVKADDDIYLRPGKIATFFSICVSVRDWLQNFFQQ